MRHSIRSSFALLLCLAGCGEAGPVDVAGNDASVDDGSASASDAPSDDGATDAASDALVIGVSGTHMTSN